MTFTFSVSHCLPDSLHLNMTCCTVPLSLKDGSTRQILALQHRENQKQRQILRVCYLQRSNGQSRWGRRAKHCGDLRGQEHELLLPESWLPRKEGLIEASGRVSAKLELRQDGAFQWHANTRCSYFARPDTSRVELRSLMLQMGRQSDASPIPPSLFQSG